MKAKAKRPNKNDAIVSAGGRKVEVVPYLPPKFAVTDPAGYKYLEDNGYAVFQNVATPEEIEHAKELFWKYMNASFPAIDQTGIINGDGIGNSEFTWFCRGIPQIKEIFKNIWDGEEDLLVSMDAAGVTRPLEYNPDFVTRGGWFHFDQNGYTKPGRHCIQGLLNLYPSGPKDGGLCVVPRTHLLFDKLFSSRTDLCDNDFVKITKPGLVPEIWNNPEYYPIKVCLDPGDFALWDSREAHCNHPASPQNKLPKVEIRRLVCYVCMTPISHAKKNRKTLAEDRLGAFRDGLTTSHWPHEYQPRGHVCDKQPEFFLNNNQKELLVGKERASTLGEGPLSSKNVPLL